MYKSDCCTERGRERGRGREREPIFIMANNTNVLFQISKVLLHTSLPGNEDDLYMKVDEMEKNGELNPVPPT